MKILPKNHNERFSPLNLHFNEIYTKVSGLFKNILNHIILNLKKRRINN